MNKLAFLSFEPRNGRFIGFISIDAAIGTEGDAEAILRKATKIYERSIKRMRSMIREIHAVRASRKPIAARKVWRIGDTIFKLKDELGNLSLQLDGVYGHLARDLGAKRDWLERVVIFRRYIPEEAVIPRSLNWGQCHTGTRRVAQRLYRGLSLE